MKFISHIKLAAFAVSKAMALGMDQFSAIAYIFGSVQPDIKITSYFRGIEPGEERRGHSYRTAIRRIEELESLIASSGARGGLVYSYRWGKVSHYAADAFTYAHNIDVFHGTIGEHRDYEKLLHKGLRARLGEDDWSFFYDLGTVSQAVRRMHGRYIEGERSVKADLDAIIPLVLSISFAFSSTWGMEAAKGAV